MAGEFQVSGQNATALFTLKLHRGEGMALLAMNWKKGKPPDNFVGFAIEALSIFDHYHFRLLQQDAKTANKRLELHKPPRGPGETAWWAEDYTNARKIRDRELFA
jgi:hypothetical protein